MDELKVSEIDEDAYTRNLVYEPVTDVFGMLGGAFGGERAGKDGKGKGMARRTNLEQPFMVLATNSERKRPS